MRVLLRPLVIVFFCSFAGPAKANLAAGLEALRNDDHVAACREFDTAANAGDASAQYQLGECYRLGRGVQADVGRAIDWYLRAAEQSHAPAFLALGRLIYLGQGLEQDFSRAASLFLILACRRTG